MEEHKITTLEKMTAEGFITHPNQAPDAINEYLGNIDEEQADAIRLKFSENPEYLESFKVAITQTSLIVFIAAIKVTQVHIQIEFDRFIREFLLFARQDDRFIYNMRQFYLSNLDAKQMRISKLEDLNNDNMDEYVDEVDDDNEDTSKELTPSEVEYNNLISNLLKQYSERHIHLQ